MILKTKYVASCLWSNTKFTFHGNFVVNACQMHLFNVHVVAPRACKPFKLEEKTSSSVLYQNKKT